MPGPGNCIEVKSLLGEDGNIITRNFHNPPIDVHKLASAGRINFDAARGQSSHYWSVVAKNLKQTLCARKLHSRSGSRVEVALGGNDVDVKGHALGRLGFGKHFFAGGNSLFY